MIGRVIGKKTDGFQIGDRCLILPPENAEALAGALLFLLESRKELEPMIRRAKEFVFAHYCLQRLLDEIRMLYDDFIECDGAAGR